MTLKKLLSEQSQKEDDPKSGTAKEARTHHTRIGRRDAFVGDVGHEAAEEGVGREAEVVQVRFNPVLVAVGGHQKDDGTYDDGVVPVRVTFTPCVATVVTINNQEDSDPE